MTRSTDPHQRFYQTPEWRRLRRLHLRRQPRCVRCHSQGPRLQVDHVKPLATHWHLRLTAGNLQTLCLLCHRHKFTDERRGYRVDVGDDGWPIDKTHPMMNGSGS